MSPRRARRSLISLDGPSVSDRWLTGFEFGDYPFQCQRVLDRVAANVVVEISPGRAAFRVLAEQPLRPIAHLCLGVAAAIFAAGTVKADIAGSAACPVGRLQAHQVVSDEAGAVAIENS